MAAAIHPIGAFLRARRRAVDPERVGYPEDARRRVRGLRREEVAVLAGLSVDYYIRLEQGRVARPSAAVLQSLAAALLLDAAQREHLHQLATGDHRDDAPALPGGPGQAEQAVRPGVQHLLDALVTAPAGAPSSSPATPSAAPCTVTRSATRPASARWPGCSSSTR